MPLCKRFRITFYFVFGLYFLSILNSAKTVHAILPDTGQTQCYDNSGEISCPEPGQPFYGQDGNYQGVQPSFHVSNDGLVVTDLNTGLMWQQADDGVIRDWSTASAYCQNLVFGGYSNWRLPSRKELISIADCTHIRPAVYPDFSCQGRLYWTSTTDNQYIDFSWYVDFDFGTDHGNYRNNLFYVRCVRGGN